MSLRLRRRMAVTAAAAVIAAAVGLLRGGAPLMASWSDARLPGVSLLSSESREARFPATSPTASGDRVQALATRCTRAMLQGTCRVPRDPSAPAPAAASRVFIAGIGEVDAAVYAEFQRQGDAMCGEVERGCRADWNGTACRIARALYPQVSGGS